MVWEYLLDAYHIAGAESGVCAGQKSGRHSAEQLGLKNTSFSQPHWEQPPYTKHSEFGWARTV